MYAVQQPLAMSAFGDVMGVPAWKSLPSWYLVAADDEAIPPAAERQFAARMGATTVEIPSSHVAMVSHPVTWPSSSRRRPKPCRLQARPGAQRAHLVSETTLTYQVYVAPIIAMAGKDIPPGQSRSTWSPISATLISGRHDAVLVDPLMTVEQGMAVADWVSTTGKNLTTVYVTHGHGDHWFGLGAIRERFPGVRAVATPAVIESMRKWSAPEVLQTFWQPRFPGQIPDDNPVADPLDGPSFELEGRQLVAVDVGHTDTDDTTVLHVPEIGLVVAGDAAYNDVHQYLAESDTQGRQDWLAALDIIEALDPRAVVAGHERYGKDDNPRIIDETRQYISDFDRLDKETTTAEELYWQMLAIHPHRVNPGALWLSAQAAKA